ncbi:MAG: hypothetical protein SynsKO_28600 [Synoicihabitans sp.]
MPEAISLTVAMLATAAATRGVPRSYSSMSAEGQFTCEQVTEVWNTLDDGFSSFGPSDQLLEELVSVVNEHSESGWDGYKAPPVSVQTFLKAREFIEAIPETFPMPELAVDPDDASISFEWHGGNRRVFSASIGSNSRLVCAGLNLDDKWHGTLRFDGEHLPSLVTESIRQLF